MFRPTGLSLIKISIHESSISKFLNEVPKLPHFQIRDLNESEAGSFYEKMYHEESILSEDIDMLNHKMTEIEENLISLFQVLEIDPDDVEKPEMDQKYQLQVENIEELVDTLHEQTENENRRIKGYFDAIKQYREELDYIQIVKETVEWLNKYRPTREKLQYFKRYKFHLFYTEAEEFENLSVGLEHEGMPRIIQSGDISGGKKAFFIITHSTHQEQVHEITTNFNAKEIETISTYLDENGINVEPLKNDIEFYKARIERIQKVIEKAQSKERKLKYRAFLEILENIRTYIEVEKKFYSSPHKKIVHLEAFVPTSQQDEVCKGLKEMFESKIKIIAQPIKRSSRYERGGQKMENLPERKDGKTKRTENIQPKDKKGLNLLRRKKSIDTEDNILSSQVKNIPSLVKINPIFRPFKRLVELYGTPNYNELDPTPIFAITFSFLFGLMFGDVGHGLVFITTGTIMVVFHSRFGKESIKDFGYIFLWMGISAVIGGFFYGEIFGNELSLGGQRIVLVANPIEDITKILKLAVLIGVIHLSIGWLMSAVNYILNKRIYLALVDPIVKIVLLACGTYLIFNWGFEIMIWLRPPYPILLAFLPAIGLLIGKPLGKIVFKISYLQEENVSSMLGEATVEVGETYLSILSNVASYTRILALSMAHIGLMLIVTTIADLAGPLSWIVVIFGNAFVIVLEGIIASIHSLRLQFYEFFGKFFTADGIVYQSDQIKNEYSLVEFIKM